MDRARSAQLGASLGYLGPDPASCCTQIDPGAHTELSHRTPVKSQVLGSAPYTSCRMKGVGISRAHVPIQRWTVRLFSVFIKEQLASRRLCLFIIALGLVLL